MGIIGKGRRSLFGSSKDRVANNQEGNPSRSCGAPKDHKKRRFPSSLFKRSKHGTIAPLIDSQGSSTESNSSPAVSGPSVDDDHTNDCAFGQSCTSSKSSLSPSLAPFEEGLFESLEESILAVDPAYLGSYDTDAGLDAAQGSPNLLQQGITNAASDCLSCDVNHALNNAEPCEQSNQSASQQDTVSLEQAQDVSTAHHRDVTSGSDHCALADDETSAESSNLADLQASDLKPQNNDADVRSSPHSYSLDPTPSSSAQNSPTDFATPSTPSPSSSGQLIGTPEANVTPSCPMESSIGLRSTSLSVDIALTLHKDGLIETLRRELRISKEQKDALEVESKSKDGLIQNLRAQKQQLDEESEQSYQDCLNLHVASFRESDKLAMETKRIQQVQKELAVRNEFISNLSSQVRESEQQMSKNEEELKELQTLVNVFRGKGVAHKEQNDTLQENLDLCRDALRTKDERITELEAKVDELVAGSTNKDETIIELRRQQASVVKANALIHEQAEKLKGDLEQNHQLRAENTQLRQLNADLETTNGYHQRYINDLIGQKNLLGTRVDGHDKTIVSLLRLDGKRQYEIKDLYHGYACLCVKARNEPVSKDVFRAMSYARYEEDHPVDGPSQDSSAPAILSPRPVRPNPAWVHNGLFQQVDLD